MARSYLGPRIWALLIVALAFNIGACGGGTGDTSQNGDEQDNRLRVVTTVSPITNIVENIGG
ncbi:MAG: hypothetical protein J4N69_08310, partial [Chloroflexi bacterium]|nr:hypothetical protein [Chloroflexota bacterium]MCI0801684.1 hypothetical protein [Chloroflexota bacterium]MCI0811430.1 hypothetical protein [Chloroflexota bacterium]MCI0830534.1 hypothetical protein [Chloroflexota bacterium]MCI0848432.1 hypothetical protein [Chloroflexota bacterium]